jgi:hypothetical protein
VSVDYATAATIDGYGLDLDSPPVVRKRLPAGHYFGFEMGVSYGLSQTASATV